MEGGRHHTGRITGTRERHSQLRGRTPETPAQSGGKRGCAASRQFIAAQRPRSGRRLHSVGCRACAGHAVELVARGGASGRTAHDPSQGHESAYATAGAKRCGGGVERGGAIERPSHPRYGARCGRHGQRGRRRPARCGVPRQRTDRIGADNGFANGAAGGRRRSRPGVLWRGWRAAGDRDGVSRPLRSSQRGRRGDGRHCAFGDRAGNGRWGRRVPRACARGHGRSDECESGARKRCGKCAAGGAAGSDRHGSGAARA